MSLAFRFLESFSIHRWVRTAIFPWHIQFNWVDSDAIALSFCFLLLLNLISFYAVGTRAFFCFCLAAEKNTKVRLSHSLSIFPFLLYNFGRARTQQPSHVTSAWKRRGKCHQLNDVTYIRAPSIFLWWMNGQQFAWNITPGDNDACIYYIQSDFSVHINYSLFINNTTAPFFVCLLFSFASCDTTNKDTVFH